MTPTFGIIQGVPRSGTSWLGQIVNSAPSVQYRFQPIHAHSFPRALSDRASGREVAVFFNDLLESDEPYINQRDGLTLGGSVVPVFEKTSPTHVIYKEVHDFEAARNALVVSANVIMVGVVRNPIDVIESWVGNPLEFPPAWDIREEWLDAGSKNSEYAGNLFGIQRWTQVTRSILELTDLYPERCLLVRYEDLQRDPARYTQTVLDHFRLPVADQTRRFVSDSTEWTDPSAYGVYRARPATPRSKGGRLPPDVVRAIADAVKAAGLGSFLVSRD